MEENINDFYIIDASFVLSYLLPDEKTEISKRYFNEYKQYKISFISTTLLPYEVINTLRSCVLRKRFTTTKALTYFYQFQLYRIELEEVDLKAAFDISIEHSISCYDAAYVALAKEKRCTLLTFDERLKKIV